MPRVSAPPRTIAAFITSSKGGPGKSTAASLLLDNWRSAGHAVAAYDADANNASLVQHFGTRNLEGRLIDIQDPVKGVSLVNVREPDSRDELLNAVERMHARILVDLPGGGAEDVANVLPSADDFFGAFLEHDIQPIVAIVLSNVKSSAASVASTIETFGKKPVYIVIKNLSYGKSFPAFDGIMVKGEMKLLGAKRALESVNGSVISMPALQEETYLRWDLASCTIAESLSHPDLTFSDKERLKAWRAEFAAAINGTALA